jgi:hypothetical protein
MKNSDVGVGYLPLSESNEKTAGPASMASTAAGPINSALPMSDIVAIPATLEPPEPAPPGDLATTKPSRITAKEAESAAKALGLSVVKVRRLSASRELGTFISQLGAVKIGRTMLAMTAEQLTDTIEQCDKLLADGELDPELRASVITTKKELLSQYIQVANSLIKSATVDASDGADAAIPNLPFLPGQVVIPATNAQVNIAMGPKTP